MGALHVTVEHIHLGR